MPEDFIINPVFNDNLTFEFQDSLRGQGKSTTTTDIFGNGTDRIRGTASCQHGVDCRQCKQFYEMAGPGMKIAGPQWSSSSSDSNNSNNNNFDSNNGITSDMENIDDNNNENNNNNNQNLKGTNGGFPFISATTIANMITMANANSSKSNVNVNANTNTNTTTNTTTNTNANNTKTKLTTVVQENVKEKASRHKTRGTHVRQESPEGFWRSDFPTTQEVEKEREIAAIRRREIARARFDQALKQALVYARSSISSNNNSSSGSGNGAVNQNGGTSTINKRRQEDGGRYLFRDKLLLERFLKINPNNFF